MHSRRGDKQTLTDNDIFVEVMEPRVLLSADALGVDSSVFDRDLQHQTDWDLTVASNWWKGNYGEIFHSDSDSQIVDSPDLTDLLAPHHQELSEGGDSSEVIDLSSSIDDGLNTYREIIFLDVGVADGELLLSDILLNLDTDTTQVYLIDSITDGVEQISTVLSDYHDLDAVHLISHGTVGKVQLGSGTLSTSNVESYTEQLNAWGKALAESGDILIYGCDLASDTEGQALADMISALTGADIAASIDSTGNTDQSADWDLEYQKGAVETAPLAWHKSQVWSGELALIAPTADAGGIYTINEGGDLNLDASGSSDSDGTIVEYKWDLNNDLDYNDFTTSSDSPTIDWATLVAWGLDDGDVGGTDYTIGLQVVDNDGEAHETSTTVIIENLAPILTTTGTGSVVIGNSYILNLSAVDPGKDTIASWSINWGDGQIEKFVGDPSSVNHTYTQVGFTHNILASAIDEDGTYLQNELLVASGGNDQVLRYDQYGSFVQAIATGDGSDYPVDIIIGPDGNYYVGGYNSSNVLRYDSSGVFIDAFVPAGTGGLDKAAGIAFGPDGNLYVASRQTSEVLRFDGASGAFIDAFVTAGSGGLSQAEGLIFGPNGDLYVSDYANAAVYKYHGLTGAADSIFVWSGSGSLNKPEDIAFGPDGNLYVASDNDHSVKRYNGATGAFIDEFVPSGSNGLNSATGVTFGPDGNLYVGSWGSDNVLRFDGTTGAYIDEYVSAGDGGLDKPDYLNFIPEHQVTVLGKSISGTIFEDIDGDGSILDDGVGAAGAAVDLYLDDGSVAGEIDASDSFVTSATTDASGNYLFGGLNDSIYWVVVESESIEPNAGFNGMFSSGEAWAEQTYGAAGSVSFSGGYSYAASTGAFYGGMHNEVSDNAAALTSAEHVTRVIVSGGAISNIDSGFSFNVITNTGDDGVASGLSIQGSLRQFIFNANAIDNTLHSLNTSQFAIPTTDANYNASGNGEYTITATVALPTITDAVVLDGTTQAGYNGTPIIELVGTSAGVGAEGLNITSDGSTISGLLINQFNGHGIQISGDNNRVESSYIGLNVAGDSDLGNSQLGIRINGGSGNTIGGAGVGNVVSGNGFAGIAIVGGAASNNVIQGNLIGTDATGMLAIGNDDYGVDLWSGGPSNNTIGGYTSDLRNVISGNGWAGIHISGSSATGNLVVGNYIGTNILGTLGIANGTGTASNTGGIDIDGGTTDNVIGGIVAGAGNLIAYNDGPGVRVEGATVVRNAIESNQIHSNTEIGIDLVNGNSDRQTPLISSVATDGGTTATIAGSYGDGTLSSEPLRIEYFKNPGATQQGATFLGSVDFVTDASGNAVINHVLAANVTAGEYITATVTDSSGNTSEFSVSEQAVAGAAYTGVNTVAPLTENTIEDTDLVFSVAGGNAVTVDDGTVGDPVLRTLLSVTNGVLNLATTAGLTSVSGDGSSSVVVTGLESAINTALDGVRYSPTIGYDGSANLQITTDLQADLLGYYQYDQANPLGEDSSPGGGNDGTPSGPGAAPDPYSVFDAERNSDVLVLDQVDDSIQIAGRFGTPTDVTLAAWVDVAAVNNQEVISIGGSIALRLNDDNNGNGVTGFYGDGAGWNHTDSAQFIGGDGWHHVAFTFDDANNTQAIYIDGVSLGTTSYTGSINWADQANTSVGSHANGSSFLLNGMLDDARVYDRALSGSEILALASEKFSDTELVTLTVAAANSEEVLATNTGMTVIEGSVGTTISNAMLDTTDIDNTAAQVVYTVTSVPISGDLKLIATILAQSDTFTQDDIDNSRIAYDHDGSETSGDSFGFSVDDGAGTASTGNFSIAVTAQNDEQVMLSNTGITVNEGSIGSTISAAMLNTADVDNAAVQIVYTVTSIPGNGAVELNGSALVLSDSFTQDDIDNGRLSYDHDGSETTSDGFDFSVDDGAGAASTGAFSISVTAQNDEQVLLSNTGTSVLEGSVGTTISAAMLETTDVDNTAAQVVYTVTTIPSYGTLKLSGSALALNGTFSQDDIDNSRLSYDHDGSEAIPDSFNFTVDDGVGAASTATFNITVSAQNDEQVLVSNTGTTVDEGSVGSSISAAMLNTTDVDNTAAQIVYTVTTVPGSGTLKLSSTVLLLNDTFTQDDIDNDRLSYDHDGSETTSDGFDFSVDDGAGAASTGSFSISVTAQNDEQVLTTNTGATVNEGSVGSIVSAAMLDTTDVDNTATQIVYTVTAVPANGTLNLSGSALVLNDTFTQKDIDNSRLTYDHSGSESTSDSFGFSVDDGVGALSTGTFNWTVTPEKSISLPGNSFVDLNTSENAFANAVAPPLAVESAVDSTPIEEEMGVETDTENDAEFLIDEQQTDGAFSRSNVQSQLISETSIAAPSAAAISVQANLINQLLKLPAIAGLLAAPLEFDALSLEINQILTSVELNESLDSIRNDSDSSKFLRNAVVGSSVAATTGLSVGYVAWMVRGGVLLSSVLSSLPAWQFIDPLPVLNFSEKEEEDTDQDDSLEDIIADHTEASDIAPVIADTSEVSENIADSKEARQ